MLICICCDVDLHEIQAVVRENFVTSLDQLKEHMRVNEGCQGCTDYLSRIVEQMAGTQAGDAEL